VIPNEHAYTDMLELEEPTNKQEILVPIASTTAINRPAAGGNSKGGNAGGSSAAGQLRDRAGSSDENDDEDEDEDGDDPPVVIDKSKQSSFTRELAGLDGNPGSAWEAPAGSCRRKSLTDHRRQRSDRLEIESAEAD
jgi:hypothetical protein